MSKIPVRELFDHSLWDLFPALAGTPAEAEFRRSMADRVHVRFELWYAPYVFCAEIDAYPAVAGLTVFARDITARKRATEERDAMHAALREEQERQHESQERIERQEEMLRVVIDAMPGLVAYVDRDCRYLYANQRYLEWLGMPDSELKGKTIEQAFGPKMFDAIRPRIEQALQGEAVSYLLEYDYADRRRWVRAIYVPHFSPERKVQGLVIFVQDVTDAQRAEEDLRRSEEQYRFLANALPQLVWIANGKGETEFLNDYWYDYTGEEREEGIAAWAHLVPPEDQAEVTKAWHTSASAGVPFDIEHRLRRSDGESRWHLARIKPVHDDRGQVVRWIGTALDIHDRKNSELELAKARRDLSEILESITESFIAVDREWRFVYVNRRVADILGISREDLIGRNMWEIAPQSVDSAFYPNYQRVMRERIPLHFEMPYPPDRWFDVYAHPTETGMSAYVVDKTDQRRAEEALRQKAKLESIGLLAGGVAHDFNNLLVGILGSASLAQEMIRPERPEHELIRVIADSAERAAHLTRQMLTYAGRSRAEKQTVDLNRIIGDTYQLLHSTIPSHIRFGFHLAPDLPLFTADTGQIQQIVVNLMTNAIEAIERDTPGRIDVHTHLRTEAAPRQVGIETLAPGEYIELRVEDTGTGMTEEVQDRIFDPFFTTKFTGRGLGLAAVRGIIRNHEGAIEVESAPGKGTRFRVLLRCVEPEADSVTRGEGVPRASGTILIIDDEEAVRTTSRRILEHHGFRVVTAIGATEGIAEFRAAKGRFAAILLDLTMPERSGFDVLRELKEELDGVPVILSSGHSRNDLEADLQRFPSTSFLQKPYSTPDLLSALDGVLDHAAGA